MATPAASSPAMSGATSAGNGGSEGFDGSGAEGDPALDAGGGIGDGGADAGDGGADGSLPATGAPAAAPFRFGQREWPSQERAEREFLTTIGRLQREQKRRAELEQSLADLRAAMQRGGGAPAGEPGQGEPGAGDGEGAEDAPLLDIDSLDWQLISGAYNERGPEVGLYLLTKALVEGIDKGLTGRMTKSLEPLGKLREATMHSAQTARLWQGAQEATDESGSLLFPELSSPDEMGLVHDIWRQITDGMPPEVANHPRMVRSAVLEYRFLRQGQGNNQGAGDDSGADAAQVAAGAVEAMRGAAQSAGVLPAARPTGPRQARQKPMTEEERIRQSLLTEGQERGSLGFRR